MSTKACWVLRDNMCIFEVVWTNGLIHMYICTHNILWHSFAFSNVSGGDILLIGEPLERFSTKRKRSLKSGRCYCTVADFFCHPSILLSLLFCWHVVDQFSPPATFIVFCAWWACSFGKFKRVVCLPQKRWVDCGVSVLLLNL